MERKDEQNSRDGVSSQAGLSSHAGGQARSLPSVPAPGQPGSRFKPVVVSREEQAARRARSAVAKGGPVVGKGGPAQASQPLTADQAASRKSLGIGMPPGGVKKLPPGPNPAAGPGVRPKRLQQAASAAAAVPGRQPAADGPAKTDGKAKQGVIRSGLKGFMGGFMAGAQARMGRGTPAQGAETARPVDQAANNAEAAALEQEMLALSEGTIEILDANIERLNGPEDAAVRDACIQERNGLLAVTNDLRMDIYGPAEGGPPRRPIINYSDSSLEAMRANTVQMRAVHAELSTAFSGLPAADKPAPGMNQPQSGEPSPGRQDIPGGSKKLPLGPNPTAGPGPRPLPGVGSMAAQGAQIAEGADVGVAEAAVQGFTGGLMTGAEAVMGGAAVPAVPAAPKAVMNPAHAAKLAEIDGRAAGQQGEIER